MPTKTLVASAYAAHLARRGAEYGVMSGGPIQVDMARVKARADAVSANARAGVEHRLRGMAGCRVLQGHARFEAPDTVRVGDELLTAPRIFINVGGRALVPDLPGIGEVPYLTNTSILALDSSPEHLVIVGGSYIGLEFAQMYRRFGSRVTVVEMAGRLIAREDEDVSLAVQAILEREGIGLRLNAQCLGVERRAGGVSVHVRCEEDPRDVVGSHLLLAVGRVPNTDDLGLDRAGVTTDARDFVQVDDRLATNVPGIWALGDVNGRGAFTHTSYNDYEIVAANLLDGDSRRVSDRFPVYALFTDPPLARAGMTEREARASGRRVLVGRRAMTRVGRARERGETQGFMQVLVDGDTQKILGAALLGIEADEAIHCIIDVMNAGAPFTAIRRAVHIHPTVSELIPTLLGELQSLQ
jgi:pyruvate/2-oxoglutarate dehydrogenase complex dihydrolipoamide dehydrogenase (E3) component